MICARTSLDRIWEAVGLDFTALVKRCIVVFNLPSVVWKKKNRGLSRDDYAESRFRTYFEVGPNFIS